MLLISQQYSLFSAHLVKKIYKGICSPFIKKRYLFRFSNGPIESLKLILFDPNEHCRKATLNLGKGNCVSVNNTTLN